MTSTAYFYSGNYTFSALADDEISMQIDGVTYINTIGAGMSGKSVSIVVPMTQGNHNLVVHYRQYTGTAYVYLTWTYGSLAASRQCRHRRPRRGAIRGGRAPARRRPPASPPSTATTRLHPAEPPSVELLRLGRPVGLAQHGLDPDRSRRSRYGATARRASSSACSWHATRRRCRPPAPRPRPAGSTTVRAQSRRRLRESSLARAMPGRPAGHRMGFEPEMAGWCADGSLMHP